MKKWIHAASAATKDLSYEYEGKTYHLPAWCVDWSDEDIEKAKEISINALKNPKKQMHPSTEYSREEIRQMWRDLLKEGFSKDEVSEIVDDVLDGRSLDSAIQKHTALNGSTSTRDRISDLEEEITRLKDYIDQCDDIEDCIDEQLRLEELEDELNFAWQDDEAEYNYAVEQQAFNPDGSLVYYGSTDIKASTELPKDDMEWMNGLWWNIDGHDLKVTGVNGYPLYSCQVTETWISEDTMEDREHTSWFAIKSDENGHMYIQEKKHPDFKLYLNSAFNYRDKVPVELDELSFLDTPMDDSDVDLEYEYEYTPSATFHDYSPSNPWDAPGMSVSDFI